RRLLEWTTAAQAKSALSRSPTGVYRRLRAPLILAIASGALVGVLRPEHAAIAAPFVLAWVLSPLVARWVSRPPRPSTTETLSASDRQILRSTARRTWRFFETFVGPDDAFLPPDNFQEDPKPTVAHRTSPTNIGLYLLSVLAARDFGWLRLLETLDRLEATLATLRRLERFRGHFYNWYDTGGLRPLEPRYVSTVDSGNLAAHLLALGNACRGAARAPLLHRDVVDGTEDALRLAEEAASVLANDRRSQTVTLRHLVEAREALAAGRGAPAGGPAERLAAGRWEPAGDPAAAAAHLRRLALDADTLVDVSRVLTAERGDAENSGILAWAQAARATIASHARDLETIMPWLSPLGVAAQDPVDSSPEIATVLAGLLLPPPTPAELPGRCRVAVAGLTALRDASLRDGSPPGPALARIDEIVDRLERSSVAARALLGRLQGVARVAKELFDAMQFGFLFDPTRKIFSIGYRVTDGSLDGSAYDLLASEARLTSFIAIAQGAVPVRTW